MIQFRASHAVAVALTAFAAVSASAQTAGAYTVTTSPDMKVCTVAATGAGMGVTAFKTSEGGTYVTSKGENAVVTIAHDGADDGQAHVIMKRSVNGEEPRIVEFSGEMKDGRMIMVTPQGEKVITLDGRKLEAMKAGMMEASTVDAKDAKARTAAPKFHVKRPATEASGQMITDGAMECRVIVRDHQ